LGTTAYTVTDEGWNITPVLYITELEMGTQTSLSISGTHSIKSLAISPITGELYGFADTRAYWNDSSELVKIDKTTGVATTIGELPYIGNRGMMDFALDGTLYIFDSHYDHKNLWSIDIETGQSTLIGSVLPDYASISAFAINDEGRAVAWGGRNGISTADWLYEINLSDGSTNELGYLPGDFTAFSYAPDGTLFGWGSQNLYHIDVDDLTSTYVTSFPNGGPSFAVIPEPATLFLLGLGAMILRKK
jgi:hypothetical protein